MSSWSVGRDEEETQPRVERVASDEVVVEREAQDAITSHRCPEASAQDVVALKAASKPFKHPSVVTVVYAMHI